MASNNIIVLGGAGYIGSHTCKKLAQADYTPITVDNLSNGHQHAVKWGPFELADINDTDKITSVMKQYDADAVIHFAGLIEVADSVKNPEKFYKNNVLGTQSVIDAMHTSKTNNIIFSSTAAVYGQPHNDTPINEENSLEPMNPYGETKLEAEKIIKNSSEINSVCLRYFNACGADANGDIGEMHFPESHLIPLIIQTALGIREQISIFGTDYETEDGTCIRDYIHVEDLADAHVKALEYLIGGGQNIALNLGSGNGYSVNEIVDATKETVKSDFVVNQESRRSGDPAYLVSDNTKAKEILNWQPNNDLKNIIESAYKWHNSKLYKDFWTEKSKAN